MRNSSNRLVRPIVLAAAVAAALAGASCGGGDDDESADRDSAAAAKSRALVADPPNPITESPHPVTSAVKALRRAFLANDIEGICARMTDAAKREAGSAGHGTPTSCPRDVRRFFGMIDDGSGWRHRGEPRMTGLTLDGKQATAVLALGQRLVNVPFTKEDGKWHLNGFFGGPTKQAESFGARAPKEPFPPKLVLEGPQTEIVDESGDRCPPMSAKRFPTIFADCEIEVSSGNVPLTLTVLTVFGDFEFEECRIDYQVVTDGTGRTWTNGFEVNGENDGVCGDVNACSSKQGVDWPWKGRLETDGKGDDGFFHRMSMCLRTCVGYFVGNLVVSMTRDGDSWKAELVNGGGSSGMRFNGELTASTDGVDMRVAEL